MRKTWTLKTLEGVNPNSARMLFDEVSKRFPSVSYGRFRNAIGRTLACFDDDSRWIPGDLIRDYFATRPAAGRYFVERYNAKLARRSENAYASKRNTTPSRKGSAHRSIDRELLAIDRELRAMERIARTRKDLPPSFAAKTAEMRATFDMLGSVSALSERISKLGA